LKFTILKDELNESIQHVSKALSSRTTIPILTGIKLDADETGVVLTASDTEISIRSHIPAEREGEIIVTLEKSGSIVIPGKLFSELIRKLPSDHVEFTLLDSHHVLIRSGSTELQMAGLDPEEYPLLPTLREDRMFSISSDLLKKMIRETIFAVSTNESTPVLTGVLWTLNDGVLKFVATDRHRLSTTENRLDGAEGLSFHHVVISGKNLSELYKLLSDQSQQIDVVVSDSQVLFKIDRLLFYTRVLDGTYPDISRIIPQACQTEMVVPTKQFHDAMDRAYLLSREEKTNIVKLFTSGSNTIELSSSLTELGRMTEQIEAESITGQEVRISFNSRYMLDALKSIDSEYIHIGFTGPMSPILVHPREHQRLLHLILPYRTSG